MRRPATATGISPLTTLIRHPMGVSYLGKPTREAYARHHGAMAATADRPVCGIRGGGTGSEGPARGATEPAAGAADSEVRLRSVPESAGVVRRLIHLQLQTRWMLSAQLTENAALLASELVSNAVRHAGSHFLGLRIRRRRSWLRVEVRDPSRALPCLMPPYGLEDGGRGLMVVDTLSDRWGVDLLPIGKTTWFELRIPGR